MVEQPPNCDPLRLSPRPEDLSLPSEERRPPSGRRKREGEPTPSLWYGVEGHARCDDSESCSFGGRSRVLIHSIFFLRTNSVDSLLSRRMTHIKRVMVTPAVSKRSRFQPPAWEGDRLAKENEGGASRSIRSQAPWSQMIEMMAGTP